jgi:hypothetical protein
VPKYDYQSFPIGGLSADVQAQKMAALGEEGWELVSVSDGTAYLKREKVVLSEPPKPPEVKQTEQVCGTCASFTRVGNTNKRTGAVPGYCEIFRWSTNDKDGADCPKHSGAQAKKAEEPPTQTAAEAKT